MRPSSSSSSLHPFPSISPLFLALFFLLFLAGVQGGSFNSSNFSLDWGVVGDEITFRMAAPTLGYVSFALDDGGSSPHLLADSYVGWVSPGFAALIDGKFPGGKVKPEMDKINSTILIAAFERNGTTTIIFKRKLNTTDEQDVEIVNKTIKVLWATANFDGDGDAFGKHHKQGSFKVNFLENTTLTPITIPTPPLPAPVPKPTARPGTGLFVATSGTFMLEWVFVNNQTIQFTMSGMTNGWVAFGLSMSNDYPHQDADIYVGWVNGTKVTLLDTHAHDDLIPDFDSTQNLQLVSGSEIGNWTIITFNRTINITNDSKDVDIVRGPMKVLHALGDKDGSSHSSYPKHFRVGSASIDFFRILNGTTPTTTTTATPTPTPTPSNTPTATDPPTNPPPSNPTGPPSTTITNFFLGGGGAFTLAWTVDTVAQEITFTMSAKTSGWVGFGISATGTPAPHRAADMYVGWVAGTQVVLLDTTATPSDMPTIDADQNVTLISGIEVGGITTIIFKRPLLGAKARTNLPLNDTSIFLLWALGDDDGTAIQTYTKHSQTGLGNVNFFTPGTSTNNQNNGGSGNDGGDGGVSLFRTGEILIIATTALFLIFVVGRFVRKSLKGVKVRLAIKAGKVVQSIRREPVRSSTIISRKSHFYGNETSLRSSKATLVASKPDLEGSPSGDMENEPIKAESSDTLKRDSLKRDSLQTLRRDSAQTLQRDSLQRDLLRRDSLQRDSFKSSSSTLVDSPTSDSSLLDSPMADSSSRDLLKRDSLKSDKLMRESVLKRRDSLKTDSILKRRDSLKADIKTEALKGEATTPPPTPTTTTSTSPPPPPPPMDYIRPAAVETGSSAHILEQTAGILGAKSIGSAFGNFLRGMRMSRLPGTQISVDHLLVAITFLLLNVFALVFGRGVNFATRLGSLAAANSLLVAIPATRNSVLVFLLGVPFDRVIMFHRWMGYWTLLVNTAHLALELVSWGLSGQDIIQLSFGLTSNLFGYVAWALSLLLFLSSLAFIRRRYFEWFFYLHFIFIPYYILGALHSPAFLPYALAAAAFYLLDRLIRLVWGLWPVKANLVVKGLEFGDREYQIIQVTFPKNPLGRVFKVYSPGQYLFVNFPGVSLLEWHPFSISSGPDEDILELHIRSIGDHTNKLLEAAKMPEGAIKRIRVDGPYGDLNLNLRRFPNLVLVSGGIGFSPVIGMLKDLYRVGRLAPDVVEFPTHVMKNIRVMWVARSAGQCSWFQKELATFAKAAIHPNLPNFYAEIYITGAKASDQTFLNLQPIKTNKAEVLFRCGRPDFEQYAEVAISMTEANMVFVCGPEQMVSSLWDSCTLSSKNGASIRFHNEIFEF